MTKRHFIPLALALRALLATQDFTPAQQVAIISCIAKFCTSVNNRFDPERFAESASNTK